MLDPQRLRRDTEGVARQLLRRHYEIDIGRFSDLESARKQLQSRQQELQSQRNRDSKEIGRLKAAGGDTSQMLDSTKELGKELDDTQRQLGVIQDKLSSLLNEIPNVPHSSVPEGKTDADNIEVKKWGVPRIFDFQARDHVELGEQLSMMNFDVATKITGSRFVVLSGVIARLQRALTQFMLNLHIAEHDYLEAYVPFLVNANALFGTGQLPKF